MKQIKMSTGSTRFWAKLNYDSGTFRVHHGRVPDEELAPFEEPDEYPGYGIFTFEVPREHAHPGQRVMIYENALTNRADGSQSLLCDVIGDGEDDLEDTFQAAKGYLYHSLQEDEEEDEDVMEDLDAFAGRLEEPLNFYSMSEPWNEQFALWMIITLPPHMRGG
ncbi:MAG: hypothetical protein ACMG6E_09150 [Candidatus Roizmanbacteria bacterium]